MRVSPLTARQVEQIRLILSTFQDGTGMLAQSDGSTLPGWRDFERTVALALNGQAQESKAIFDVLVVNSSAQPFGISCKMRRELNRIQRDGRVALELSNSAGKFWGKLNEHGLHSENYKNFAQQAGISLINLIAEWHEAVSGQVDLARSYYLALQWNKQSQYQLFQFPIHLPDPTRLHWHFSETNDSRCLKGDDSHGTLFEWYGESGGQLKYYPLDKTALWASSVFKLEPLPQNTHGILSKAAMYFPRQWAKSERLS